MFCDRALALALCALSFAVLPFDPVGAADEVKLAGLDAWQPAKGWSEVASVKLDPADASRFVSTAGAGVLLSEGNKVPALVSKEPHGDAEIHVEFNIPAHSNSGVYVMSSYEVQIYDSHGVEKDKYPGIECGGIYPEWIGDANVHGHSPKVNAALPAGEWQTFDIVFRAPRFDAQGHKTANARFEKIVHNGRLVQENVEVLGPTRGGMAESVTGKAPLLLQGDHGVVAYRNVTIKALEARR